MIRLPAPLCEGFVVSLNVSQLMLGNYIESHHNRLIFVTIFTTH